MLRQSFWIAQKQLSESVNFVMQKEGNKVILPRLWKCCKGFKPRKYFISKRIVQIFNLEWSKLGLLVKLREFILSSPPGNELLKTNLLEHCYFSKYVQCLAHVLHSVTQTVYPFTRIYCNLITREREGVAEYFMITGSVSHPASYGVYFRRAICHLGSDWRAGKDWPGGRMESEDREDYWARRRALRVSDQHSSSQKSIRQSVRSRSDMTHEHVY